MRLGLLTLLWGLCSFGAYSSVQDIPSHYYSTAAKEGVPVKLLYAITLQETQTLTTKGRVIPWKYSLNHKGKGYVYKNKEDLKSHAEYLLSNGIKNFDIGIGQINYRWHHQNFSSLDEMINPHTNLNYAAKYLKKHYKKLDNWWLAAGAYHAPSNPKKAEKYMKEVHKKWLNI